MFILPLVLASTSIYFSVPNYQRAFNSDDFYGHNACYTYEFDETNVPSPNTDINYTYTFKYRNEGSNLSLFDLKVSYVSYVSVFEFYTPYDSYNVIVDFSIQSSLDNSGLFCCRTLLNLGNVSNDVIYRYEYELDDASTYDEQQFSFNLNIYVSDISSLAYTNGYDVGKSVGEDIGYSQGLSEGLSLSQDGTITEVFTNIVQIGMLPVNFFLAIFNYEIFGINLSGFVSGLITIAIIVILFRFILGNSSGGGDNTKASK